LIPGGEPYIAFEEVSKRFRRGPRHANLRSLIPAMGRSLLRPGGEPEAFWALRDVSFQVRAGEVLGIIGPNGSGKSTVLKLLSGILRPDNGQVVVRGRGAARGRVGALIELAAGFHPELSGRENIHLQGAVLGMRRNEVARKFDAIVEFAELADFIDTPVKHFSSGMHARLGFAVAVHLDPDVLIIDEVLSVGDLAFQQKAFARLREAVRRDIPVVVVSHQLDRILELCDHALLLTRGEVACAGTPEECVASYVGEAPSTPLEGGDTRVRVTRICGPTPARVRPGERVRVQVHGTVAGTGDVRAAVGVRVRALPREEVVFVVHSAGAGVRLPAQGDFQLEIDFRMNVGAGTYRLQAAAWDIGTGRELDRTASVFVAVEPCASASGRVYPDPQLRLLPT
jgi:lipopolysaccharide transport system ATP-binding protein